MALDQYIELKKNSTLILELFIKYIEIFFANFHMSHSLGIMLEV